MYDIVINLEYILSVILLAKHIVKLELRFGKIKIACVLAFTIISTIIIQLVQNKVMDFLYTLFVIIVILRILSEERIGEVLLYALVSILSINVLGHMIECALATFNDMVNLAVSQEVERIISLVCLMGIIVWFSREINPKNGLKSVSIPYLIVFIVIVLADSFSLTLLAVFVLEELAVERKWIAELVYIFVTLGVFVQLGLLIATILSRDEHKEKEALNAKYLEEQAAHYDYLKNREQDTRRFRHDMRNHLMVLRNLYDTGKKEKFEEYFDTISQRIADFGNQISVGNDIADAIINQFVQEAAEDGIKLNVDGHFPSNCNIAAVDICTILSNLLSNAIRAEKDAKGEEVRLIIRNLDGEIFVEVENDYVTEVKRRGECFVSTKKERANHGLGLQNVQECVEKNCGVMHITTAEHIFNVKLNLKNTEVLP